MCTIVHVDNDLLSHDECYVILHEACIMLGIDECFTCHIEDLARSD